MSDKGVLKRWVVEALGDLGGSGNVLDVCKHVWRAHRGELEAAGDLFYTWQYDIRWAAQVLRADGVLKAVNGDRRAPWTLAQRHR